MPKISVIVPIYGVERFISRCAHSLFEQTLDDIEFIFVNDCTTDHSMDILAQEIEKYRPVIIKKNYIIKSETMPTNSGLAAVRRHGLRLATGKYIIHCDSDDWVDITMFQKLYEKAISDDCDIVVTGYRETDGIKTIKESLHNFNTKEEYLSNMLCMKESWAIWDKLCLRELYNEIEFPIYSMGEDMILTFQLVMKARKISNVKELLYNYYFNSTSITKVQKEEKRYNNWEQSIYNSKRVICYFEKNNLSENYSHEIELFKYKQKKIAGNLAFNTKYAKAWFNTFPSTHKSAISHNLISMEEKIKYLLVIILSWLKS